MAANFSIPTYYNSAFTYQASTSSSTINYVDYFNDFVDYLKKPSVEPVFLFKEGDLVEYKGEKHTVIGRIFSNFYMCNIYDIEDDYHYKACVEEKHLKEYIEEEVI